MNWIERHRKKILANIAQKPTRPEFRYTQRRDLSKIDMANAKAKKWYPGG